MAAADPSAAYSVPDPAALAARTPLPLPPTVHLRNAVAPFLADGRPVEAAPEMAQAAEKMWAKAGIKSPLKSADIVKAIAATSEDEPEGAVTARMAPVAHMVAADALASALAATGAPECPLDTAAKEETTMDVVASVVSSKSALEAIGVAAASGFLARTLSTRKPPSVQPKRAGTAVSQAQAQIEADAEQLALIAERAGKRRRDRLTLDTSRPLSSAHSKPVADEIVDDLVDAVPPAVAARFLAKRARMLADQALVPASHAASSNMSTAFALWATAELAEMARPGYALGTTGKNPTGEEPLAEADVGPELIRRWHALSDEDRARWWARCLTLSTTAALMPVRPSDIELAGAAHQAAKHALASSSASSSSSEARSREAVQTTEGLFSPEALAALFDKRARHALDSAMRADTEAGTAVNTQPRIEDFPSVPPRPFHHFVRATRKEKSMNQGPAARGFWTNGEYLAYIRAVWKEGVETKDTVAARNQFSRAIAARNERLNRWVASAQATHRQAIREAIVENFETVGAEPPAALTTTAAAEAAAAVDPTSSHQGRREEVDETKAMAIPTEAPRPPMTPFMAFVVAVRRRLQGLDGAAMTAPVKPSELSATDPTELEALGHQWRSLTQQDRAAFADISARDKVRFAAQQRLWEAHNATEAMEEFSRTTADE